MNKGKFVVIYGMNNIGKSTLTEGVIQSLRDRGIPVKYLKYPIYDLKPTGPRINAYLREGNPENLTALEAQGQYAQNRRDFEPTLDGCLDKGEWIVAEDYTGTGLSWGVTYGVSLAALEEMNQGLKEPDLALLLDGERFTTGIEENHKHEGSGKWELGRRVHQQMAKRYDWVIIKANQTREKVLADTIRELQDKFPALLEGSFVGKERK